jgi:RNA polymerase sigma-70 factor (ECF subfamily)
MNIVELKPKDKNEKVKEGILDTYKSHLSGLRKMVLSIVKSRDSVEDILQDAFLNAYAIEKNKPLLHPKAYLYRTTKNLAISAMREQRRKPTDYLTDLPELESREETGPDQHLIAQQTLESYFEAIESLPPKCRHVFLMRKCLGLSYKEIAKKLNISVSTVETHLERAFARCDAYLSDKEEPGMRGVNASQKHLSPGHSPTSKSSPRHSSKANYNER